MAQYTTEAIVLGVHNWGAADKMVWLLSPEHGKLKAAAYGCRRPKSPLAGGLQLFNRLDVSLNSGSQLDTLRQCTMKGRYRKVGEDLTVMAYAAFVAELTLELLPEGMPQPDIYQRLLEILAAFETRNPRLVALAAACQLLELSGLQMSYTGCVHCGFVIEGKAFFAIDEGGAVCDSCAAAAAENLGEGNIRLIPYTAEQGELLEQLTLLDWHTPPALRIGRDNLLAAEKLILAYLYVVLGKRLKSLDFLQQLG